MRARRFVPIALGLAILASFAAMTPRESIAQCNRACPADQRDEHGCCPSAVAPKGTSAPAAAPTCQDGQEVTADTAGHCCWSGQVWSTGKCVGVPTKCPEGREVEKKQETCKLRACASGMVRAPNDKEHCCFSGQAWSKARSICVGVPSTCPSGWSIEGESCISPDRDSDGIPNDKDKCPTVPEDKNGFEDADGCPDEQRRVQLANEALQKQQAEEQRIQQERNEQLQKEDERRRVEAEAKAHAEEAKAAEEKAAKDKKDRLEDARSTASHKRTSGEVMLGAGAALGVGGIVMWSVGAGQRASLTDGSLATGKDIESARTTSVLLKVVSLGAFVAPAAILGLSGLGLTLANLPPSEKSVAVRVGPGAVSVGGAF